MNCLASRVLRDLLCDLEVSRKESCSIKTDRKWWRCGWGQVGMASLYVSLTEFIQLWVCLRECFQKGPVKMEDPL